MQRYDFNNSAGAAPAFQTALKTKNRLLRGRFASRFAVFYFWLNQSLTISGGITASTKV